MQERNRECNRKAGEKEKRKEKDGRKQTEKREKGEETEGLQSVTVGGGRGGEQGKER